MTGDSTVGLVQDTQPRGSLRLLADPTFGPFLFGQIVSTAGIWIHNIAAAIVVYDLTGSATMVGAVSIAQFAPQLLLTPLCGAMADRGNRRTQLVWGRLVTASGSGVLAAWILLVGIEGQRGALVVIATALLVGVGFSLGGPAMQALIPSLIKPGELPTAVALSSAPLTVARAGGPAIGALIVTGTSPAAAFIVAAAGNLLFAAIIVVIRIRELRRDASGDHSILGGFRHVRHDRVAVALLLGAAAAGMGADPIITLSPAIARELGGGAELVGALASAFGVGTAVAFPWQGWLRRRVGLVRLAPTGLATMAAGLALLALTSAIAGALAGTALAGVGFALAVVSLSTQLQQRAPERLRGRVMSMWTIAFVGSRPLAAGVNGAVADLMSTDAALAVTIAILVVGATAVRPSRLRQRIERGTTESS